MSQNSNQQKNFRADKPAQFEEPSLNQAYTQEKIRNSRSSVVEKINFISDIYMPEWLTIPLSKNLFIHQTAPASQEISDIYFAGTKNLDSIMKRLNDLDIFERGSVSGKLTPSNKVEVDVLLKAKQQWDVRAGLAVHDKDAGFQVNGKARNLTGLLEVYTVSAHVSPFHTVRNAKAKASFPLMEYFKFCQPNMSYNARKESPNTEIVVKKVGVCIKDQMRNGSLNIQHVCKGIRKIPKLANVDFENMKLADDYIQNYSGLRVLIKKNLQNSFSKNKLENGAKSDFQCGFNLGLHNANETFLEAKYTQKKRITIPENYPYLNLFHIDMKMKIEGVQPILNTNANSIHHPRSYHGEHFWSSRYVTPLSRRDNFRISFQPQLKTNDFSILGKQRKFQSYLYWNSHIGVNTLGEKMGFGYDESAGIGLKYKLANRFNINLGVQLLRNRKIQDAIFLNFTSD